MTETLANPDDTLARYIFSSSNFGSGRVKHGAFIPPNDYPNELSVCVTSSLNEDEIWSYSPVISEKTAKARADLIVSDVQTISDEQGGKLGVFIDGNPHPFHANIKSLPLDKSKRRAVAAGLANKSSLVLAA
jgi:hypothetical protein